MTCTTSEWSLLNESVFSLLWSYGEILAFHTVNQQSIDVREVDPNFVVATLTLFLETQRAAGDGKGACGLAIWVQISVVSGNRIRQPIHRCTSRSPQRCGASVALVSSVFDDSFFNNANGSRITARLAASCSTIKFLQTMSTCSCNITVRTACSSFFPKPRFLTKWLVCSDIMVEKDLPFGGSLRNHTREMTA